MPSFVPQVPNSPIDGYAFQFPSPPSRPAVTSVAKDERTFREDPAKPNRRLSAAMDHVFTHDPKNTYTYSKIKDNEIRLLFLFEGEEGQRIECALVPVELNPDPEPCSPYEALSYNWGTDDPVNEIRIRMPRVRESSTGVRGLRNLALQAASTEHRKFHIRWNLYTALRQLRMRDRTLVLWVDALCINQEDKQEKNHQVSRMAEIYSRASNVCIWLGESDDKCDKAMDFVRHIVDLSSFDKLVRDEGTTTKWDALAHLLRSRWFSRRCASPSH